MIRLIRYASARYKAQWLSHTIFEGLSSHLLWSRPFYGYTTQAASHCSQSTIPSHAPALSHPQSEVTDSRIVRTPPQRPLLLLPPWFLRPRSESSQTLPNPRSHTSSTQHSQITHVPFLSTSIAYRTFLTRAIASLCLSDQTSLPPISQPSPA